MRSVHGYVSGPEAATEATGLALDRVADPVAFVLVEGVSDQIAIDTLAMLQGRDLVAERIAVVPIGGAHAITRFLGEHPGIPAVALCDAAEEPLFLRALDRERVFTCVADLEDELIRAVGTPGVEALLAMQGDLGRFRTLQKQAQWRGRPPGAQLRRWLGAGARRKSRYARLLAQAAGAAGTVPEPLDGLLQAV